MSIGAALEILGQGGQVAEVPYVLRTGSVVQVLGDRVRSRLCAFAAPDGSQWCLRPDLTAPILIGMTRTPISVKQQTRYHYHDVAFRLVPEDGNVMEFTQAGFEWFGGASGVIADVEAIETAIHAVAAMSVARGGLRLGDAGLWGALVDAVEMDAIWRRRFRRAWLGARGLREMVISACAKPKRSALARVLASIPPDQAASAVEDVLVLEGAGVSGRRGAAEIASALIETGNIAPLARTSCDILLAYLDIGGQARRSADAIETMTQAAGLDVSEALQRYVARLDRLSACVPSLDTSDWEFGAQFGRSFDYYDGLVFEVTHRALPPTQALARGGRYDGVLSRLGIKVMPALGAALHPGRIAVAAMAES